MSTKCLISTSIITLFTASIAHAADIMVPRESRPVVSSTQMSKQVSPPVEMSPNSDVPPVISAPTFSWNGFYLGGQIGGFSGKTGISLYAKKGSGTREWTPVEKDTLPQLSGFMGGLYAGANVDLGNSLILGVDTDIVWSNKQDTKVVAKRNFEELELEEVEEVEEVVQPERRERQLYGHASVQSQRAESQGSQEHQASSASSLSDSAQSRQRRSTGSDDSSRQGRNTSSTSDSTELLRDLVQQRVSISAHSSSPRYEPRLVNPSLQPQQARQSEITHIREMEQVDEIVETAKIYSNTLKQKWSGATRVRIGFAVDRIVPYIAGGVAYAQIQNTFLRSIEVETREVSSSSLSDTKMMVGYTLGGGVDFAMADNVILRAEYRYSDFGKQKFAKDKLELDYQTNDFRVGVAYKF
ncbi:outer membrane protein [Bartonella sp. WD12.1]|uniref:outer membrane protein n=1 Tax=Bartonella sp. WD12.1 TaxID=1933903 RepID=UPI00099B0E98|nr:outer membrane protein [Bartonella sp. WD12.1]OPB29612.1 Outer membrane protein beta-barrel domain-containing protein [Bartonella sp. WD12.1]